MWRQKSVSFTTESAGEESFSIHPDKQSVGILPHSRLAGIPSIHHQHSLLRKKCSPVLSTSYGSLGQLEVSCHQASPNPSPPMPSLRSLVCRNRTQQPQQAAVSDAPLENELPCIPPEGETSLKREVSCASLGHSRVGYPDLAIRKSETAVGLSSLTMDEHSQKIPGDQSSADGRFVCPNQNSKGLVLRALNRKEREMLKPFVSSRNLITREISASTRNLLFPLRREFSASCTSSASPSFPSPSATSPLLLLQNSGNGAAESVDGEGPMKPVNRLRMSCSRCSSLVSLSASRLSLGAASPLQTVPQEEETFEDASDSVSKRDSCSDEKNESGSNIGLTMILDQSECDVSSEVPSFLSLCKLCLTEDIRGSKLFKIQQCGCLFCQDCMHSYVQFEIQAGAYDISCPDAQCPTQGVITMTEIETLVGSDLTEKHRRFRLYREVDLDIRRVWCPVPGCDTVCTIPLPSSESSTNMQVCQPKPQNPFCMCPPQRVVCPTCNFDFCSACRKPSHVGVSCEKAAQLWGGRWSGPNQGTQLLLPPGVPPDSDLIKCCPMCCVPIEKDEGCAQMMCKRCKHVFCWYCLTSLDDDFLLRHYDKGPCKNKLGHSRASVIWHRAQVIGIFAGFGILLLVASPLLLLAAPCIVCCKCRVCTGAANGASGEKLEEEEEEEVGAGESIGIVAGKVAAHGLKTNSAVNEIQEVTQGNS